MKNEERITRLEERVKMLQDRTADLMQWLNSIDEKESSPNLSSFDDIPGCRLFEVCQDGHGLSITLETDLSKFNARSVELVEKLAEEIKRDMPSGGYDFTLNHKINIER